VAWCRVFCALCNTAIQEQQFPDNQKNLLPGESYRCGHMLALCPTFVNTMPGFLSQNASRVAQS